ncbi:RteC domain-containing protein [Flavobacterium sp.]|uniref:RteC domain-containing protein n=1 Tax=Flavobacterium sp. TaxID=239 RepID=UPI00286D8893|nr:RteC domain-containing protein [Flavobacterium sp.]
MRQTHLKLLYEIETELHTINQQSNPPIHKFTTAKNYLEQKATEVNSWLRNHQFECEKEEIHFFKNIKSQLLSKIMVSKFQLDIALKLPHSKKAIPDYYQKLILKHSQIPKSHNYFYKYFRSESTHRDQEYFLRKNNITNIHDQYQFLFCDERITTKMEFSLAELLAKEQIIEYLESELDKIENPPKENNNISTSDLQWTGTKFELIELIYALHHQKVINHGRVDLKEVAKQFYKTLNIDYEENIYRYYSDIKLRKTNKTRFMQSLSDNLNQKLSQEE